MGAAKTFSSTLVESTIIIFPIRHGILPEVSFEGLETLHLPDAICAFDPDNDLAAPQEHEFEVPWSGDMVRLSL